MTAPSFAEWVGRWIEQRDEVVEGPVRRLAATLDHGGEHWPSGSLPLLGHWLFHLPDAPRSALGQDGHPAMGGFLPPIAHPRRMWAGGRVVFHHPIAIGASLLKRTTIAAVVEKGAAMTFVTLRHELSVEGVVAVEEEQDLVYLPIAAPRSPRSVEVPAAVRERRMIADELFLFRFSALTFNAHRIHYDLAYAREVELYPHLVVHGPLQAMLLLDHAVAGGAVPRGFQFRACAPLFAGRSFCVAAAHDRLWVRDGVGTVTMTASIS